MGLHAAFHEPSDPAYRRLHGALWVAIGVSVLLVPIELFTPWHRPWLGILDRALLSLFWVELILRVGSYRPAALDLYDLNSAQALRAHVLGRLRFCTSPVILVDLITVLGSFGWLRGLRVFRALRLLHGTRLFRYSSPLRGSMRAFAENRLLLGAGFALVLGAVLLGGISFYAFEKPAGTVAGLSDALWWALVTLTTVGYGDISPVTGGGRLVAAGLMLAAMALLALMAGIFGQTLMGAVSTLREEAFRMGDYSGHIVVCGYDAGSRMLLDAVEREYPDPRVDVVVFARGERPADVPPRFAWVPGDPTKESELAKVRMEAAKAVIVVGTRSLSPQAADATSLLTLFTIRRYMRRIDGPSRKQPLYLVAEILDAENVDHARAAGADEVIETTLLGFSLLAHAVRMPGTAQLMSQVAMPDFHSLFVGPGPDAAIPYGQLAARLKAEHGVLLIGLRDAGGERINPPDDTAVAAGTDLLYLAPSPVLSA